MMKRVLVFIPNLAKANGIASFFVNYINQLKGKYSLDFYLIENKYDDEIYKLIKNQGNIFFAPRHNKINKYFIIKDDVIKVISQNDYDFVHLNLVNIYAVSIISGLKKAGFKNIIYHAHNPHINGNLLFLGKILKNYCVNNCSALLACSKLAGDSVFGKKKYTIIHNSIICDNYLYDEQFRNEYRANNVNAGDILIGCVGRLEVQKNPVFTLKIMKELKKINDKYKIFFVGDGSMESKLKEIVKKYKIESNVKFLGSISYVNKLYSAFDVFLLPSKFEGLGIVFVEAQVSNLPVFTSKNVPIDINITDNVHMISLKKSAKYWAHKISTVEKTARKNNLKAMKNNNYDSNFNDELLIFYDNITGGEV